MLQEISLPQLIADNEDSYIELACRLGIDAGLRQKMRNEIQAKMNNHPAFLNSRAYAMMMAQVFQDLHESKYP